MTDRPATPATQRGILAGVASWLGLGRPPAAGVEGGGDLLRLQAALTCSPDAFCSLVPLSDAQGTVTDFQIAFCNPAFAHLWRSSGNAQAGALLSAVLPAALARTLVQQYAQVLLTGEALFEERERLVAGEGPDWLRHHAVAAADGVAVTLRDITEQRHAQERLKQITPYDLVTGLPNLLTFQDRMEHALLRARRVQRSFGLMALELGDISKVFEVHGESLGNQVLKQVAARVRRALRDSDTLGRVGPYRFMVILEDERDLAGADTVSRTLMKVLTSPVELDGLSVQLTASIGATLWGDERQSVADLETQADVAQQAARRSGANQHMCWTAELAGRPAR
jgi:diguanylate cyclase (GGDEF)-like protein